MQAYNDVEVQPMDDASQRAALVDFIAVMHAVFEDNLHKNGWRGDGHFRLLRRLFEEITELQDELALVGKEQFSRERLEREGADVANFAMMIVDEGIREHEKTRRLHVTPRPIRKPRSE
jgi:NTP pyrophosphatase (non-canonical NTP hydrolase)